MKLTTPSFKKINLSVHSMWFASLIGISILTIAVTVYAIILFIKAQGADVIATGTTPEVQSLSREELKETVADFETKVRRFNTLTSNAPKLPPPPLATTTPATTTSAE